MHAGVPLVPITLDGSYRVIVPKTLQVNPGVTIRIKIGRPIDLSSYAKGTPTCLYSSACSACFMW